MTESRPGRPNAPDPPPIETPAKLFEQIWATVADTLGAPATAALVRRSLKASNAGGAEIAGVDVVQEGFEYRWVVPPAWGRDEDPAWEGLRALTSELARVLVEMTGPVVVQRLEALPAARRRCLFPTEKMP